MPLSPSPSLHSIRGEMQAGFKHVNEKVLKKIICIIVQLSFKKHCIADVTMATVYTCVCDVLTSM